jgi:hypothetical protein
VLALRRTIAEQDDEIATMKTNPTTNQAKDAKNNDELLLMKKELGETRLHVQALKETVKQQDTEA